MKYSKNQFMINKWKKIIKRKKEVVVEQEEQEEQLLHAQNVHFF